MTIAKFRVFESWKTNILVHARLYNFKLTCADARTKCLYIGRANRKIQPAIQPQKLEF